MSALFMSSSKDTAAAESDVNDGESLDALRLTRYTRFFELGVLAPAPEPANSSDSAEESDASAAPLV